jgi:hypothetical protein
LNALPFSNSLRHNRDECFDYLACSGPSCVNRRCYGVDQFLRI